MKHLRALMEFIPGAEFFNLYGPTETNVCAFHRVASSPNETDPPVPIGAACAHCRVAVLGRGAKPLSAGRVGELYVGGASLMEGYCGDRARGRLVDLDLDGKGVRRWYKTGDLAFRDDRGLLRFVGRRDDLVKRSGYRISLGEIESALYASPDVTEAAAIYLPAAPGPGRLLGIVRPRRALPPGSLEALCAGRLPRYMRPEIVATDRALPRTRTGKIDRSALAALFVDGGGS